MRKKWAREKGKLIDKEICKREIESVGERNSYGQRNEQKRKGKLWRKEWAREKRKVIERGMTRAKTNDKL